MQIRKENLRNKSYTRKYRGAFFNEITVHFRQITLIDVIFESIYDFRIGSPTYNTIYLSHKPA